jgi:hypothetical protein
MTKMQQGGARETLHQILFVHTKAVKQSIIAS